MKEENNEIFQKKELDELIIENEEIQNFDNVLDWDKFKWKKDMVEKEGRMISCYDSLYIPGTVFHGKEFNYDTDVNQMKIINISGEVKSLIMYCKSIIRDKFRNMLFDVFPVIIVKNHYDGSNHYFGELKSAGKANIIDKYLEKYKSLENEISYKVSYYGKDLDNYTFRIQPKDERYYEMFIIGGIEAAKNISFNTFLYNFKQLQESDLLVEKLIQKVYDEVVYPAFFLKKNVYIPDLNDDDDGDFTDFDAIPKDKLKKDDEPIMIDIYGFNPFEEVVIKDPINLRNYELSGNTGGCSSAGISIICLKTGNKVELRTKEHYDTCIELYKEEGDIKLKEEALKSNYISRKNLLKIEKYFGLP